ncbi:MAG: hypothetical protein ACI90V_010576 [Bacillariaceae sp.]|jgi:hypothetical protein
MIQKKYRVQNNTTRTPFLRKYNNRIIIIIIIKCTVKVNILYYIILYTLHIIHYRIHKY